MNVKDMHRKAIESQYNGICDVYEQKNTRDAVTKINKPQEVLVLEKQPCKISFSSLPTTKEKQNAAAVIQVVKLFIAPEIEIKPGSKIVVTQNNVTGEYCRSGISAVYSSHQEINLELFGGYA